jgi:cation diffusion facilitator family transporter
MNGTPDLRRYAWLSVGAAVTTIALKTVAWALTGSVGLLSDAAESLVNLVGALFALWMLTISRAPPDDEHQFGHGKAEYFAAGFTGILILIAAAGIAVAAVGRLIQPVPLGGLDIGIVVSLIATTVNLVIGRTLIAVGRRHHSLALEGDGRHLMTDVYTSVGVVVGLGLVVATGWTWLDAVVAFLVAGNIVREAASLLRRAADGLMDHVLPEDERAVIDEVLATFRARNIVFDGLRTKRAGHQRFIAVDVLVPGDWTVADGHAVLDEIEAALGARLPGLTVATHLAPRSHKTTAGTD